MITKLKYVGVSRDDLLDIYILFIRIGGGPQGTLLGGIEYMVQSNDNADVVPAEDRFKYIDDLSVLHLICLSGLLVEYNFFQHVASDIGIDEQFLPASSYETQKHLNYISNWTRENLMRLNEAKSNYLVFSRSKEKFATRLTINGKVLDKLPVTKIKALCLLQLLKFEKVKWSCFFHILLFGRVMKDFWLIHRIFK